MATAFSFDEIPSHEFNVSVSTGVFSQDPNLYYDAGDIAWMMISTALVFLMIPGVALFNSGISGRESALSMLFLPMLTGAVISLQWWLWGYSIAFSDSLGSFWGTDENFTLKNVVGNPSGNTTGRHIPEMLMCVYQMTFAAFTAALVSGCVVKKSRFGPFLVFIVLWSTFVYDPIARWSWNPNGWSAKWGNLDFAGGTVVHINAACTAAAYSFFFRIRARLFRNRGFKATTIELQERESGTLEGSGSSGGSDSGTGPAHISAQAYNHKSVGLTNAILGTVFLWVGWFGFNGGSALGSNLRAVSACTSTFLAACAGGVTWCFLDYLLLSLAHALSHGGDPDRSASSSAFNGGHASKQSTRSQSYPIPDAEATRAPSSSLGKFSILGFCNGAIAGLVAITPAAGFVPARVSPLFGIVGATACSLLMYKNIISRTLLDTLNIFVIHGVGGAVGMVMTAVFANKATAALDGYTVIAGGWLDHNWRQLGVQIGDAAAGATYSAGGTILILLFMEGVHYLIWKRPMEDGSEVVDADDIIVKELF